MNYQVIWSPEATEDLELIAEYIARDSEFYSHTVVTKILDLTRTIGDHPLIGKIVPEIEHKEIRECPVYSYRIIYKVKKEIILIVAIIHGKRLLGDIDERFE